MISLELLLSSAIGLLAAAGIYLILRARTFPVVLGLAMIGYAVNLFLFAMGRIHVNAPAVLTETAKATEVLHVNAGKNNISLPFQCCAALHSSGCWVEFPLDSTLKSCLYPELAKQL